MTTTVQASLTPALTPQVTWSYMVGGNWHALTTKQTMNLAQKLTSQMEALASGVTRTITLTNTDGNRLTFGPGGQWFPNNYDVGWDWSYLIYPPQPS